MFFQYQFINNHFELLQNSGNIALIGSIGEASSIVTPINIKYSPLKAENILRGRKIKKLFICYF